MTPVVDTYKINDLTCALIPTRSLNHQTKVIELKNTFYVNQSPFELIRLNCLLNGSNYLGRREAITYHLGFKRKVPIAISKLLHAFPTHSVTHFDCMWIFSNQITQINQAKITFKNKLTLALPVTNYILNEQHLRCSLVGNLFKKIKK